MRLMAIITNKTVIDLSEYEKNEILVLDTVYGYTISEVSRFLTTK